MQRKWRREWERCKAGQLTARSKNSAMGPLKTLARTILPPVTAAAMLWATMTMPAYANPTGGQVTSGAGSIAQNGNTMNITQTTNKMSINWQSFNIAANETVNFVQPGASSIALNRVVGNNASSIYGHLNANGQVFLVNTNGVLFAPGSSVNVGGIVASTLNISDSDFQKGNYTFSGNGGSVVNKGTITAVNGGYVALQGGQVSNQGVIVANQGTVALGAGNAVTLDFTGDGLYSLAVNQSALNAVADNQNLIQANGGQVVMTARAANDLAGSVLNNTGVIEAQSVGSKNGVIILDGGTSGAVINSGTLDASGKSAEQTGGTVKVLGDNLSLTAGTKIDVSGYNGGGTALIGGNAHGQGSEQNATSTVVAKSAAINADAVTSGNGGKVVVWANDTTNFDGTISAKGGAISGDGGSVETSGSTLTVGADTLVKTLAAHGQSGNWLLDPTDFTISLGSEPQTSSGIGVTTLLNNLANSPVTITTSASGTGNGDININAALGFHDPYPWDGKPDVNGLPNSLTLIAANNIYVNAPITWSVNTLTLNAGKNVYVNNTMTATGTANLTVNYGAGSNSDSTPYGLYTGQDAISEFLGVINFSGTGSVTLRGTPYTVISSASDFTTKVTANPSGNYVLGTGISGVSSGIATFTGNLNGFGHWISYNLTGSGLFDTIGSGGTVSNLLVYGTVDPVAGNAVTAVGSLANVNRGSIINSISSSTLNAASTSVPTGSVQDLGGLVGDNYGLIAQSYSYDSLYATNVAGALVGRNEASGRIIDCGTIAYPTLYVAQIGSGSYAPTITYVGGLVGVNDGTIQRSYANTMLTLNDTVSTAGGLVGKNTGTIDQCYTGGAYGSPAYSAGTNPNLAGFVWENSGNITNSYSVLLNYSASATGTPTTQYWTAGFVDKNTGTISNAYTTEYVTNTTTTPQAGFASQNNGTITNSYWYANINSGATAPVDSTTAISLNATQAATYASYKGFDTSVWASSASGFPVLGNLMVYVSTNTYGIPTYGNTNTDVAMLGLYARGLQGGGGSIALSDSTSQGVYDPASRTFVNVLQVITDNGYVDAGTQTAANVLTSSVYKNIRGTVTVNPKALTIAGEVADKTYDGTTTGSLNTAVANNGLVGLVGNQTLNISYSNPVFSSASTGTAKSVTLTYSNLSDGTNGGKAGNYTISNTTTNGTTTTTTTTGNILPKTLTAIFTGADKTYDGTTTDAVTYVSLTGVVGTDTVSLSSIPTTGTFADTNAGSGKTVTISGLSLTGTSSSNYTIAGTTTAKATITPLALTLYGAKAPDGSTTVSAASLAATNAITGDSVTLSGSVKVASAAAGVSAITDLSGLTVNNANYTLVGSVGSVYIGNASQVLDHVASGTATVSTSGSTTTVTSTTDKAIIDWLRFSVGSGETVNFVEPAATSIVLNRVTGNDASTIAGKLTANGRVFIINANGVLFAAGSSVNAGALVASTLNMNDTNFINGNYVFTAAGGKGSVVANGDIVIVDGGFMALVSNNGVSNIGSISATSGKALLVSADSLTLSLNTANSGLAGYAISSPDGTTTVGGVVNVASASGTGGGLLETAGNAVNVTSDFQLGSGNYGTWSWSLPAITVGSSGNITPAFVKNNLVLRNLSLNALSGDLTVNAPITWATDATLTLSAKNNININNAITATGTNAGFAMNYGGDYNILTPATYSGAVLDAKGQPVAQSDTSGGVYGSINLSGSNASLTINGNKYTLIRSMDQLDLLDKANGVTGLYYNPLTGKYDASTASKSGTIGDKTYYMSWGTTRYYLDPTTGATTIPMQNPNDSTQWWDPETGKYDLAAQYNGHLTNYYYNPATGLFTIPNYDKASGLYWDPSTGSYSAAPNSYGNSSYNGSSYFYDITTNKYDIPNYNTVSSKYYDRATGGYTSTTAKSDSNTYYFDTATGFYDSTKIPYTTGYYALANNLDAAGKTYIDAPILYFSGTFTGLGHTISNLTITSADQNVGLFGMLGSSDAPATSLVRDLGIVKASITSTYSSGNNGILAGYSYANISKVYTSGTVTANAGSGGLVGYEYGASTAQATVADCYSDASGVGGGLVGRTQYANYYRDHATGAATFGGLINYATAINIYNSYATGTVTGSATSYPLGGLIGQATSSGTNYIQNSFATGTVTGGSELGGLAGFLSGNWVLDNCYATGNITSNQNSDMSMVSGVGGLIGAFALGYPTSYTVTISHSHATGNVTFTDLTQSNTAGGLVGNGSGSGNGSNPTTLNITNSYATGNVTLGNGGAGGLVGSGGSSSSVISNSYATGNVSLVTGSVGGLAGSMAGTITDSYAAGNVTGTGRGTVAATIGGVVGNNMGKIINSYSSGSVTGVTKYSYVGGIAGANGGSITGSYAAGRIIGASGTAGGLVGYNRGAVNNPASGVVTNSYYNSDLNSGIGPTSSMSVAGSPSGNVDASKGLTGPQMSDVQYYLNGTINQVQAARVAEQQDATQQASAGQQFAAQEASPQDSISSQVSRTRGDTLQNTLDLLKPASLWQSTFDDKNPAVDPGNFSARVKSIEVDGAEYQLDNNDANGKENKQ